MKRRFRFLAVLLSILMVLAVKAALAADPVKTTDYFNIHYGSWQGVAEAITPYLNAAFTTPRDVLGYDNGGYGKIEVYFYSDSKSGTAGYTYPGENAIHINLIYGDSTKDSYLRDYGSTVAHETGHVLFFHETKLQNRYGWGSSGAAAYTWISESLSYYIGDVVYPHGPQYSKAQLGSMVNSYSSNGSKRSSWLTSGNNYMQGSASSLDLVQLKTIGKYLADSGGWGAIQSTLRNLAAGNDYDTAFRKAFGKETGMTSTASGADVNTLYSGYINYYLGHY
ncbi:MAG: hypothetical protein HY794_08590 [Desulfarculus sp.]|nr:hypothetical protein [Desulfarculus sp.]